MTLSDSRDSGRGNPATLRVPPGGHAARVVARPGEPGLRLRGGGGLGGGHPGCVAVARTRGSLLLQHVPHQPGGSPRAADLHEPAVHAARCRGRPGSESKQGLGISPGETTPGQEVTLTEVECLCACEMSPMGQLDETLHRASRGRDHRHRSSRTRSRSLDNRRRNRRPSRIRTSPATGRCSRRGSRTPTGPGWKPTSLMTAIVAARKALTSMTPEEVIDEVHPSQPPRPGRGGVSGRQEVVIHPQGLGQAEVPGGQCRRGRAGDLQGPLPHGAGSTCPARRHDHRRLCDRQLTRPMSTSVASTTGRQIACSVRSMRPSATAGSAPGHPGDRF